MIENFYSVGSYPGPPAALVSSRMHARRIIRHLTRIFRRTTVRIAVERPSGFSAFARFIFRNFYAADWRANADIWSDLADELPELECACITVDDRRSPHLAWMMDFAAVD